MPFRRLAGQAPFFSMGVRVGYVSKALSPVVVTGFLDLPSNWGCPADE